MATITLTIGDNALQRVVDAIATRHGWTEASGMNKGQFAKAWLAESLRAEVRAYEGSRAAESARIAAETRANDEITVS